jgi:hypothetical protein
MCGLAFRMVQPVEKTGSQKGQGSRHTSSLGLGVLLGVPLAATLGLLLPDALLALGVLLAVALGVLLGASLNADLLQVLRQYQRNFIRVKWAALPAVARVSPLTTGCFAAHCGKCSPLPQGGSGPKGARP